MPYLAEHYEMEGVAFSSSLQFVVRAIVMITCCLCDSDLRRCFVSMKDPRVWNRTGLSELNQQGWISFVLKVMGWWAFDVFTLLAASLTTDETSAQTIMRNVGLYTFMIPVGFMQAANFLTGKYIGLNRIDLA